MQLRGMQRASSSSGKASRGRVLDQLEQLLEGVDAPRLDAVRQLVSQLVTKNEELTLLLAAARAKRNQRERVSRDQLDIFIDLLRAEADEALAAANQELEEKTKTNRGRSDKARAKQPPVRKPPPPNLRRVPNPIPVPETERPCPKCNGERRCAGHTTTHVIELIPAEVIVREDQREVLVCDACDGELERAEPGEKVIASGYYGPMLVAWLLVGKFWDGLPLNRMKQQLERLGLSMPSSSIGDQVTWATDLLKPIWMYLMAMTLQSTVMHVDSTSLPVKDRDHPKGLRLGSLWGYVGDTSSAVFLYTKTGKAAGQEPNELGPADILARRTGFVCADAAGVFDASMLRDEIVEVGCNMHARRYFVKALDAGDARAALAIDAFKTLYDVEACAADLTPDERLALRQQRSKPVYDALIAWCKEYQPYEPPSSLLAAAIRYLTNHEVALTRFLADGRLPIDNGIVERIHRRPAMGRRAYLFAGSHAGAERAAIAYSIIATCQLVGVNPQEYLADVLPRLARGVFSKHDFEVLAPAAWKAARDSQST